VLDILSNRSEQVVVSQELSTSIEQFTTFFIEALEHLLDVEAEGILGQADFVNYQRCCKILCDL
jgi:hypothetical protein